MMPPAYGNIKSLIPKKNDTRKILRLVRKYEVPDFYGGKRQLSLECIFHDEEVRNEYRMFAGLLSFLISKSSFPTLNFCEKWTDGMLRGIYNGKQCDVADIAGVLDRAWSAGVDRIVVNSVSEKYFLQ